MMKVFWKQKVCVVSCQGCLASFLLMLPCVYTSSSSSIKRKICFLRPDHHVFISAWYIQKCPHKAVLLRFVNVLSCECWEHTKPFRTEEFALYTVSVAVEVVLWTTAIGFSFSSLSNYNFVIQCWLYDNWRPLRYSYGLYEFAMVRLWRKTFTVMGWLEVIYPPREARTKFLMAQNSPMSQRNIKLANENI